MPKRLGTDNIYQSPKGLANSDEKKKPGNRDWAHRDWATGIGQTNKWATGIGHTDTCIRLSAHYRLLKFAPDVAACVVVTVSWRLVAVPRQSWKTGQ
jgi:hypothetical protein